MTFCFQSPVVKAGLNGYLEILILLLDAGHNVDEEEERVSLET